MQLTLVSIIAVALIGQTSEIPPGALDGRPAVRVPLPASGDLSADDIGECGHPARLDHPQDSGCGVQADGSVRCWGAAAGWAGTVVPQVSDATAVAVGPRHACVLRRAGDVFCWGAIPGLLATRGLVRLNLEAPARAIAVARDLTLVATDAGAVAFTTRGGPQKLTHRRPRAVRAADGVACVLDDDGAWCWGGPQARPQAARAAGEQPARRWVVAYGNRVMLGGGGRVSPRASREGIFDFGGVLDVTVGPYEGERQPIAVGVELGARSSDLGAWRFGGGLTAALTNDRGAAVLLSVGADALERDGRWEPLVTASARTGARLVFASSTASGSLGHAYKFELSLYVSAAVGVTSPRLVEVTGGLATDVLVFPALAAAILSSGR